MDNDDNIQFEAMPSLDWGGMAKAQQPQPEEKEYNSLYEEMIDKCNPTNFDIATVGLEMFNVANGIFAQLTNAGSSISEINLIVLRNRAIDELGIHFTTKKKFEYLKSYFSPEIYINRVPCNEEKVREAGFWYDKILKNKNDVRALEKIEYDATAFIQKEKTYQQSIPSKIM